MKIVHLFFTLSLLTFVTTLSSTVQAPLSQDNSKVRDQLLSNILKHRVEVLHFSQKKLNDELSKKAYQEFLKRIDNGKQFLTQEDLAKLAKFQTKIDDSFNSGDFSFVRTSTALLKARVKEVEGYVEEILKKTLDYSKTNETFQTDPEKRDFAKNSKELKELWQKTLNYTVITNLLNIEEEQKNLAERKRKDKKNKEKLLSKVEMESKARDDALKLYKRIFLRITQEDHNDELERFFNSVLTVFDPHTNYMPPQKKEDFDIEMKGTLEGIGALLKEDGQYIKVVKIIPGSASWKQKQLQPEDTILKVGQDGAEPVDIVNMRIDDAVKLIRGAKGTKVHLTVKKPTGEVLIVTLMRDVVEIEDSYAKGAILQNHEKKFGYINLPKFYRDFEAQMEGKAGRNCSDDVNELLKMFSREKVAGVILDLRGNGGGALEDAKLMSGLFIKKGPIVQVRSSQEAKEVLYDSDDSISYTGPLIVLINRFSASASEILAGALQDYKRAIIVGGDHSHGKGTVQILINLDQNLERVAASLLPLGALKVTIQKFYRINGASTQYMGVVPDVVLPDPFEYLETGERYLDYSLPWDQVQPLKFEVWNHGVLPTEKIKSKSLARTSKDQRFQKMRSALKILKDRREETVVSLSYEALKAEKEKAKADSKLLEIKDVNETIEIMAYEKGKLQKINFPSNYFSELDKATQGSEPSKAAIEAAKKLNSGKEIPDWVTALKRDPYIDESLSIIQDLGSTTK